MVAKSKDELIKVISNQFPLGLLSLLPNDAGAVKDYLTNLSQRYPGPLGDTVNLSDSEALQIREVVNTRWHKTLLDQIQKLTLDEIEDNFLNFPSLPRDADVRNYLNQNQVILQLANEVPDGILTAPEAARILNKIIEQRIQLLIETIGATSIDAINSLLTVFSADDNDAFYLAMDQNGRLGQDNAGFSDDDILRVKQAATKQYIELLQIKISQITLANTVDNGANFAYLPPLSITANRNETLAYFNQYRQELDLGEELKEAHFSDEEAAVLRDALIFQRTMLLVEVIEADGDPQHFVHNDFGTTDATMIAYLQRLQATDADYYGGAVGATTLPSAAIAEIKKAIISRKESFALDYIKTEITQLSIFPAELHPKLIRLIEKLPKDKQLELLDNNAEKLNRLLSVKEADVGQIDILLRECGFTTLATPEDGDDFAIQSEEILRDFYRERALHEQLSKARNFELAQVLAGFSSVSFIPREVGLGAVLEANYIDTIAAILNTNIKMDGGGAIPASLSVKFGEADIKGRIIENSLKNEQLRVKINAAPAPSKFQRACYNALAFIPKENDALEADEIDAIVAKIEQAKTWAAFRTAMLGSDRDTLAKIPRWEWVLTPDRFNEIKRTSHFEALLSSANFAAVIRQQKKEMQEYQQILKSSMEGYSHISKDLLALKEWNTFSWLTLKSEAVTSVRAQKMLPSIEILAKASDKACHALMEQRKFYQTLKKNLPSEEDYRRAVPPLDAIEQRQVNEHRKEIDKELENIESSLKQYALLSRKLNGDPTASADSDANKGILKQMREAAKLQTVDHSQWGSLSQHVLGDCAHDEIESQIQSLLAKAAPEPVASAAFNVQSVDPYLEKGMFANTGELKEDRARIHLVKPVSIAPNKKISAGIYVEKRAGQNERHDKQEIEMTLHQYPKIDPPSQMPLSPEADKALKKAQVAFITDMATDLLARIGGLPTPEKPIILRGTNPEAVGMLWTALVELCKTANPKFNEKEAIKVYTSCFNPESQKGWRGYTSESYYRRYFDNKETGKPFENAKKSMKTFQQEIQTTGEAAKEAAMAATRASKAMRIGAPAEGVSALGDSVQEKQQECHRPGMRV